MRLLMILFSAISIVFASSHQSVNYVDPQRFSGLWYEIARTYNDYEKDCVAATVEYLLDEDGYEVTNRCFDTLIGGDLISYEGSVSALSENSMHHMEMTYFWIFSQEYHVIYINDDYSSAIVSDEDFEQVWIMHREPTIEQTQLALLLEKLKDHMDLDRLIFTPQDSEGRYK